MKKLFTVLLFLLLGLPALAQNITTGGQRQFPGGIRVYSGGVLINDQNYDKKAISETTANISLYVRTTGNDANDCLSTTNPCLTIQAAINKLPHLIKHAAVVDVGAGTFAGFNLDGRIMVSGQAGSSLTITGANFIAYTPVGGGTGSGTFTSGTADFRTGTDAGQGWAVNALRGKICYVNGVYQIVRKNTATTLELVGASASTLNGKAYQIMDWATILNAQSAEGTATSASIISVHSYRGPKFGTTIQKFSITPSSIYGVFVYNTMVPFFSFVNVTGGIYGFLGEYIPESIRIRDSVFNGQSSLGVVILATLALDASYRILTFNTGNGGAAIALIYVYVVLSCKDFYADDNPSQYQAGILIDGSSGFMQDVYVTNNTYAGTGGLSFSNTNSFRITNFTATGNNQGVVLRGNIDNFYNMTSSVLLTGTTTINNNTNDGLHIMGPASFRLEGATGTGNGGWGVRAANGAKIFVNGATTLTGSSGDATVDGTNPLTWATTFAADGNSALNIADLSNIVRRESMQ